MMEFSEWFLGRMRTQVLILRMWVDAFDKVRTDIFTEATVQGVQVFGWVRFDPGSDNIWVEAGESLEGWYSDCWTHKGLGARWQPQFYYRQRDIVCMISPYREECTTQPLNLTFLMHLMFINGRMFEWLLNHDGWSDELPRAEVLVVREVNRRLKSVIKQTREAITQLTS